MSAALDSKSLLFLSGMRCFLSGSRDGVHQEAVDAAAFASNRFNIVAGVAIAVCWHCSCGTCCCCWFLVSSISVRLSTTVTTSYWC